MGVVTSSKLTLAAPHSGPENDTALPLIPGRQSHLLSLLGIFSTSPRPFSDHDVTLLRALLQYIVQPRHVPPAHHPPLNCACQFALSGILRIFLDDFPPFLQVCALFPGSSKPDVVASLPRILDLVVNQTSGLVFASDPKCGELWELAASLLCASVRDNVSALRPVSNAIVNVMSESAIRALPKAIPVRYRIQ